MIKKNIKNINKPPIKPPRIRISHDNDIKSMRCDNEKSNENSTDWVLIDISEVSKCS
tara:strand:- start:1288 stop:1458 length:171 start_codon:yes stop_codon:yes gene_type:complete